MAESRGILTIRLNQQLGTLVSSVKIGIQNNLSLFNIVAETTLAELLNRVYGWELVNANAIRQNCPGIDLIDAEQSIAVQVTSTRKAGKVRNALEKTGKLNGSFEKLVILVITHEQPTKDMKNCALPGNVKHMDIWSISDVLRDALVLSVEKLQEITDFLDLELGSVKAKVGHLQHLELPPQGALPPSGFVGREKELAEIRHCFDSGDKEVYLTGLGGMGKTELAIHYGLHHRGTVHLIRFSTSFQGTLAKMAHSIRPELCEEDLRLEESILANKVLKLLKQSGGQDLLIIDNVDSDEKTLAELQKDPCYEALLALPLRLLLTTRSDAPRPIRVNRMPDDPLFEIFRNHGAELSDAEMRALIEAVNGHTLTIDLIARTLNGKGWRKVTAEKMLTALRESSLKDQKYRKIATDYNRSTEHAQIYQHLSTVFDVSGMNAVCRQVMGYATLLPDGGMDGECFGMSLSEEEQDALDTLLEQGWLEMKSGLLTIHPVIRLVCRTEQPLTEGDCEAFLDRLWEQYDEVNYNNAYYHQMAELLTNASSVLADTRGQWALWAGILWNAVGEFTQALRCNLEALQKIESHFPKDTLEQAHAYNNTGGTYGNLGDHHKALEYKLKAMVIFEKVCPPVHPDMATSYSNVGYTYGQLGDHSKALDFKLKALNILEECFPQKHFKLAQCYNNVGSTYDRLGKHAQALDYQQKSLAIRTKILPPDHPLLALTYNNVGFTYFQLDKYTLALEYQQKALTIWEKALSPEHPLLALCCCNISWSYHSLGNFLFAAQYMRRAADIIDRSDLPKTHSRRVNYPKWADEYEKKAEMQRRMFSQLPDGISFPFGTK